MGSITNSLPGERFDHLQAELHGPGAGGILEMHSMMRPVDEDTEHWHSALAPLSLCVSVPHSMGALSQILTILHRAWHRPDAQCS